MSDRPSTLARSWSILRACAQHSDGLPFNELRRSLGGLVASTLSRQLDQLQELDLVRRDDAGRYRLGPGFLSVARLASGREPADLLPPLLRSLSEQTRASCSWWRLDGDHVVLQEREEWPEGFHHVRPGFRRPLTDTAFGSAVLAALPIRAWPVLAGQFPNHSHRNAASLRTEVASTRAASCCVREDAGAHGAISRFCSAITCAAGVLGSIGISIPAPLSALADPDGLQAAVVDHAQRASDQLASTQP